MPWNRESPMDQRIKLIGAGLSVRRTAAMGVNDDAFTKINAGSESPSPASQRLQGNVGLILTA
ncbi:hypothetical protein PS676_05013 [Pseudomonas fluorescens]|nr:hypothetical protein PS676_05013 [Pseudomonas fluorescens]